jgi:NAD(P)-dependent dehydrogenase (short-subunit alcohol dehydrogenase family)
MPTLLITGGARGIGLGFVRDYAASGWSVIATVRNEAAAESLRALGGDIRVELLDMRDFAAVAGFAGRLGGAPLDLFIANAGITRPEGLTTAGEAEGWLEVFAVNVVAPSLLAETLAPNVIAARGKMVAITSQMGSIADNNSGGWTAYRASKSALNAAWRSMAVERAHEPIAIAMLHPGWVRTDMGGAGGSLSIPESVASMRRVIDRLSPKDKGVFLNHRGETLPW